jgi:hypothetical protein
LAETPCSPIEWGEANERNVIRGWLRGYPGTTLYLIRICDDRPDRGTMTGAFVPDADDGQGHLHRGLLSWLKTSAAVIYLREFYNNLSGVIATENYGLSDKNVG